MTCFNCLEEFDTQLNFKGVATCQTCGAQYSVELIEHADHVLWHRIATGKSDGYRLIRHGGNPPTVSVESL